MSQILIHKRSGTKDYIWEIPTLRKLDPNLRLSSPAREEAFLCHEHHFLLRNILTSQMYIFESYAVAPVVLWEVA